MKKVLIGAAVLLAIRIAGALTVLVLLGVVLFARRARP